MEDKIHVTYDDIHRWVIRLSEEIVEKSKTKPEVIIGIGGGGLLPARLFRTKLKLDMYVVFISFYEDNGDKHANPKIKQWLDSEAIKAVKGKHILIVDEINDSGATIDFCIEKVLSTCDPSDISVAVLQDKDREKTKRIRSDVNYYVGQYISDKWVLYPWTELEDTVYSE